MRCNNPNYIYFSDNDSDNKKRVKFINGSNTIEYLEKLNIDMSNLIEVPCGRCVACRLAYSAEWADRCDMESKLHKHTWFITLTYRDECLVYGSKGFPTVEKDAISCFIRKLRDKLGHDTLIRYFGCAEYGEGKGDRQGFNPHYHIIVFGPNLDDLTIDMPDMSKDLLPSGKYPIFRRQNRDGDFVMFSQTIYDCWKKGKIEVEEASWNCCAYVSRYVVKKQFGRDAALYERLGILPEYLRMSTKPGIGANYLLLQKNKLLRFDYLSVKNKSGVKTYHPPRYFEKLMNKDCESVDAALMESNKLSRINNAKRRFIEESSRKSVKQKNADNEEILKLKTKMLTRSLT